jgi:hypothetical protein
VRAPRGSEQQRVDAVARGRPALQRGQHERRRLAAARLRDADAVAARERGRYDGGLHGRRAPCQRGWPGILLPEVRRKGTLIMVQRVWYTGEVTAHLRGRRRVHAERGADALQVLREAEGCEGSGPGCRGRCARAGAHPRLGTPSGSACRLLARRRLLRCPFRQACSRVSSGCCGGIFGPATPFPGLREKRDVLRLAHGGLTQVQ